VGHLPDVGADRLKIDRRGSARSGIPRQRDHCGAWLWPNMCHITAQVSSVKRRLPFQVKNSQFMQGLFPCDRAKSGTHPSSDRATPIFGTA
jgi:hypothetical protein